MAIADLIGFRTRTLIAGLTAAGCLLAAPSLASAANITVNDDTTGPGPAGATCATPDQPDIVAGIAAAAASGDRVLVCAGTYTQPQILIDKSVDVIGTGPGLSIIDGGNSTALPSTGLIRTGNSTNGDVLVQGFTVRNPGQVGAAGTPSRYGIVDKGDDLGTTHDYNQLDIQGLGAGGRDYGIDADNPDNNVIFRNGSISNTDFNPMLLERVDGAVTVRNNVVSPNGTANVSSIFVFSYSGDDTINPIKLVSNSIDANTRGGVTVQTGFAAGGVPAPATMNSVDVIDNDITDFASSGLTVSNTDPAANGLAGLISNVDIEGNTLQPTNSTASNGVRVLGLVRNVSVQRNILTGLNNGLLVNNATAGHGPEGVDVHFNRIAADVTAGLSSNSADPVNAERNWWGCNEGPNQTGCSTVTGANVDFNPWLILRLAATPGSIQADGGHADLTADVTTDSAGNNVGGAFPETPIAFGTTLGTVRTPVGTSDGVAKSTLNAGSTAGTATVNADLDGESVTAPVTITSAPAPPVSDTPPLVSLGVQPTIKAGERGLLTASVTDDHGVTDVTFYAGPKPVCQVLAPPYECLFRPRKHKGRVAVSAIATDTVGQTGVALGSTKVLKAKKKK